MSKVAAGLGPAPGGEHIAEDHGVVAASVGDEEGVGKRRPRPRDQPGHTQSRQNEIHPKYDGVLRHRAPPRLVVPNGFTQVAFRASSSPTSRGLGSLLEICEPDVVQLAELVGDEDALQTGEHAELAFVGDDAGAAGCGDEQPRVIALDGGTQSQAQAIGGLELSNLETKSRSMVRRRTTRRRSGGRSWSQ